MIAIKTYLRKINPSSTFSIDKIKSNPLDYFVAIDNEKELLNYYSLEKDLLNYYTRGVIVIELNYGERIIDFIEFDLIVPLWWNFLVGVEDYLTKSEGILQFQDQGLSLKLIKGKNRTIKISKFHRNQEVGYWQLDEKEFVVSFLSAAKKFYLIGDRFSESNFQEQLKYISDIEMKRIE